MMQLTTPWPSEAAIAERQAAAYLPLHGTRSDRLPTPWPDVDGFPKPATVLRSLTAWLTAQGPQPITTIPTCTTRWLASIPDSHQVMQNGLPWLTAHQTDLWPSVAIADLLAMWAAVEHGVDDPFTVPAVRDAVELWTIYQAIRQHVHAAVSKVAKEQQLLPTADPATIDALITTWRERIAPPALASTATMLTL